MKSKAMVQIADRKFDLQEFEIPRIGKDEALLRVEACGLCGSDVEQYQGGFIEKGIVRYPLIPGHEPVGTIEEIGPDASTRWRLKSGDRIAVIPGLICGRCENCLGGTHHLCRQLFPGESFIPAYGLIPTEVTHGLWGGYSEYIVIHPNTLFCRIPDNVPSNYATVYQALAAGLRWATDVPDVRVGDSVLVLGCGQRGLASVIALSTRGAGQIIVTGLSSDLQKLEMAKSFGATHTINVTEEDVLSRVMEITNGRGVDVAVEIVPVAAGPVIDAVNAVKMGGTVVLAGIKGGSTRVPLDTDRIVTREISIRGVMTQSYEFYRQALDLLGANFDKLSKLHTHDFLMEDVEEAILTLAGTRVGETAISISINPAEARV